MILCIFIQPVETSSISKHLSLILLPDILAASEWVNCGELESDRFSDFALINVGLKDTDTSAFLGAGKDVEFRVFKSLGDSEPFSVK